MTLKDLENWNPPDPYACYRSGFAERDSSIVSKDIVQSLFRSRCMVIPRDLMGYMDLMIACATMPEVVIGIVKKGSHITSKSSPRQPIWVLNLSSLGMISLITVLRLSHSKCGKTFSRQASKSSLMLSTVWVCTTGNIRMVTLCR